MCSIVLINNISTLLEPEAVYKVGLDVVVFSMIAARALT